MLTSIIKNTAGWEQCTHDGEVAEYPVRVRIIPLPFDGKALLLQPQLCTSWNQTLIYQILGIAFRKNTAICSLKKGVTWILTGAFPPPSRV